MTKASESAKREALERVRAIGLAPKTVFDVGVATGTPGLYGIFPDVRYVMVEPLLESAPFMAQLVEQFPGSIAVHAAAGRQPGEGEFVVNPGLSGSSFGLKPAAGQTRTVPITTLDVIVREHALEGPFLIKIDVQGFEMEVLAGAEETLKQTDLLILEASLWGDVKRKGVVPKLLDLLNWLDGRGFVLYDIAQIVRRRLDSAITEMDLVFCPADSPLRKVTSYKSADQMDEAVAKRRKDFGLT